MGFRLIVVEYCLKTRRGNFAGTTSCHDTELNELCRPSRVKVLISASHLPFGTFETNNGNKPYQHLTKYMPGSYFTNK